MHTTPPLRPAPTCNLACSSLAASLPVPMQWVCLAILAGMALFYRTLFFGVLKYKERKSR